MIASFLDSLQNPETPSYYAGIGSQTTPAEIRELMTQIARRLEAENWTLRSGAAEGADSAFAEGVIKQAVIWLPWASFRRGTINPRHQQHVTHPCDLPAHDSVRRYHPDWKNLSTDQFERRKQDARKQTVFKFMSRNFRQVVALGNEPLLNSKFVLCWTPDGSERGRGPKSGGTGQALAIAWDLGIPIHNLNQPATHEKWIRWLNTPVYTN